MPRRFRFVVDDAYYHILNRGNNRQNIFKEKTDYEKFLELIEEYLGTLGIEVNHYILMTNHYHLIVRIKIAEDLKKGMQQLNQTYARYFRKKYGGVGYFWQGRYKSFLIEKGIYLLECGIYIELNPVRARIVKDPKDYRWSSYNVYAQGKIDKIITPSPEYEGLAQTKEDRMRIYRELLEDRIGEKRKLERYFKTGVCGSGKFKEKMKREGLFEVWSHGGRPKKNTET